MEPESPELKPVEWVGRSQNELLEFPDDVVREVGYALYLAQLGRKSDSAKPLKGFGSAGVVQVTMIHDGDAYRAVYTVLFSEAVYVLHCFQKKSSSGVKTQPQILQLIHRRLAAAREHYGKNYTNEK
ncbi:MAG: type II toxin-antitoxin system RelE/ParE family toxin [Fimbriiglobus sp.]